MDDYTKLALAAHAREAEWHTYMYASNLGEYNMTTWHPNITGSLHCIEDDVTRWYGVRSISF